MKKTVDARLDADGGGEEESLRAGRSVTYKGGRGAELPKWHAVEHKRRRQKCESGVLTGCLSLSQSQSSIQGGAWACENACANFSSYRWLERVIVDCEHSAG